MSRIFLAALAVCLLAGLPARAQAPDDLLDLFDTSDLLVPENDLNAGIPPDAIRAFLDVETAPAAQVDFLSQGDRIVRVETGGQARGYPLEVLVSNEIAHDVLGGVPIAVTFCPLCDSVSVLDRRESASDVMEFGVSGILLYSNLVMFDRENMALWPQAALRAVSGPRSGDYQPHLPFEVQRWENYLAAHPDEDVMTGGTEVTPPDLSVSAGLGLSGPPEPGGISTADAAGSRPAEDLDRLAHVIGVRTEEEAWAFPLAELHKLPEGRLEFDLSGGELILQAGAAPDEVAIVEMPEDARAWYGWWFAWESFHPDTNVYVVPEPGSLGLLIAGAATVAARRRRKKRFA